MLATYMICGGIVATLVGLLISAMGAPSWAAVAVGFIIFTQYGTAGAVNANR